MENRIDNTLKSLAQEGKKAFISFVTAGDPAPEHTINILNSLVESGVDILEVGVPFSDPQADGPSVQKANERALVHNVGLNDIFEMLKTFRANNDATPVVLMGYLNPIEKMGYETFAQKASESGVDGLIVVDNPPEEGECLNQVLNQNNIHNIFLLAPTTTDERLEKILQLASGFVYYVSLKGVTGASTLNVAEVEQKVAHIRTNTSLPVGVGFGISNAETANAVAKVSDAVVVGSALVNEIEKYQNEPQKMIESLSEKASAIKAGINKA